MADQTIGRLNVKLTADASPLTRTLRGARATIRNFVSGVAQAAGKIAAVSGALSTLLGSAGFVVLTQRAFGTLGALAKMSDRLGIASEKLATLHLAAKLGGSSIAGMNRSLQRMLKAVSEANLAKPIEAAARAFRQLGIDSNTLARLSPDKMFDRIGTALAKIGSISDRIRISREIFGGGGIELLTVATGRELGKIEQLATKLGLAMSRIDLRLIEQANKALVVMRTALGATAQIVAVQLAPLVEALAIAITEIATRMSNLDGATGDARTSIEIMVRTAAVGLGKMFDGVRKIRIELLEVVQAARLVRLRATTFLNFPDVSLRIQADIDALAQEIADLRIGLRDKSFADNFGKEFDRIIREARTRAEEFLRKFSSVFKFPTFPSDGGMAGGRGRFPNIGFRTAQELGLQPIDPFTQRPAPMTAVATTGKKIDTTNRFLEAILAVLRLPRAAGMLP